MEAKIGECGWTEAYYRGAQSEGWGRVLSRQEGGGHLVIKISPIFPSGCEGKLGVALESLQGVCRRGLWVSRCTRGSEPSGRQLVPGSVKRQQEAKQ